MKQTDKNFTEIQNEIDQQMAEIEAVNRQKVEEELRKLPSHETSFCQWLRKRFKR